MQLAKAVLPESDLRNEQVGRIGEHLVSYYLESNGINCHSVRTIGSDIWCELPDGRIRKCEIKSAPKIHPPKRKYTFYSQKIQRHTAHFFAFAALDLGLVIFKPSVDVQSRHTTDRLATAIEFSEFTEAAMMHSLNYTLDHLNGKVAQKSFLHHLTTSDRDPYLDKGSK